MQNVDTLIHARWIIPIEPEHTVYENYSLAIYAGKILDLLPTEQANQRYQSDNTLDLKTHALTAGFVNAHTHAAMTLMRGIADDLPLMDWLQNHIWVLENKWMSEEFVRDGTDLAIAEMLRGGTTCFNDMYFFPDVAAKQAIPGLGHPIHKPVDPRTKPLLAIAERNGFGGVYIDLVQRVQREAERKSGKNLPLNATGAIGAIACELGFEWGVIRGFGVLARSIGLVGHIMEERRNPLALKVWTAAEDEASSHFKEA